MTTLEEEKEELASDIVDFAELMETVMKENLTEKRLSYRQLPVLALVKGLEAEFQEFQRAMRNIDTIETKKELLDVANRCMMLHRKLDRLKE